MTDRLRERFAEIAHDAWCGWMKYLFSKMDGPVMPSWAIQRWKRQMETSYSQLSEEEKNSDRAEADKYLSVLTEGSKSAIVNVTDAGNPALAEPDVCEWYRDGGNMVHGGCQKCNAMPTNLLHAAMSAVEDHRSRTWFAPGCGRKIEVKHD